MLETSTNRPAILGEPRGESMVFKGVRVRGDLQGPLLRAEIEQRFVNESDKPIEAVYTFPLPFDGVILEVHAQLGNQEITGSVIAKAEAEERYEQAVADGDAALMVETNSDGNVTLNLGNLLPGEGCTVRIRYGQLLRFEQGGLRLVVPTVIAPRYGDPIRDGGLQPHQVTAPDIEAEHPFALELRLHGALSRANIESPSHLIRCDREASPDVTTIRLEPDLRLDRDFVLVLQGLEHVGVVLLQQDPFEVDSTALLGGLCTHLPAETTSVTMHLLVDCSGSMAGDSIHAARQALRSIMAGLREGDRFSLSRFGSEVEHRSRELWAADEAHSLAARHWIDNLEADLGGTDMEPALQSTLALADGTSADILLLTDGEVHAIDAVIATARRGGRRIFVVGIGSSPAEGNLRRLAESTAGACDFVGPAEKVEPAMLRMFARMRSAHTHELRLENLDRAQPAWLSGLEGPAFDGDTLHLAGTIRGSLPSKVALTGLGADGNRHTIASALVEPVTGDNKDLARMAAAVRLRRADLDASLSTELALRYQLASESTRFLLTALREDGQRTDGMPALHKVRPMLAAGWGGLGSAQRLSIAKSLNPVMLSSARFSGGLLRRERWTSASRDEMASLFTVAQKASRPNHAFEVRSPGPRTPLQVRRWLRTHRPDEWPTTIAGLEMLGIPEWVLTWIKNELVLRKDAGVDEAQLASAFLEVVWNVLATGTRRARHAKQLNELGLSLYAALNGVTASKWIFSRSNDLSPRVEP